MVVLALELVASDLERAVVRRPAARDQRERVRVARVRIDRRDAALVRARLRVDRTTPVKADSTAIIDFAGITGVTFVQINAGSEGAGPILPPPLNCRLNV